METKDKTEIVSLLEVLSEKLKKPENKELLDYFLNELSPLLSTGEQRLDDIYELCIERIIKEQAAAFYKDFPISEICSQLESDYIGMERARRNNDFGEFSLKVYQQIECITNYACRSSKLQVIVSKMWGYPAFVKTGKGVEVSISERDGEYTIGKLVLIGDKKTEKSMMALQNLYALDKIRTIVYYYGFRAMMKNSDFDSYIEITSLLSYIYNCRNLNHRGNIPTLWEQEILDKILPLQSLYYFKFLGVLAQYVSFIKNGMDFLPSLENYANSLEKKEIKKEPIILSEAKAKKIDGKVKGNIIRIKSGKFELKIDGKLYIVNKPIKDGLNKGDVIEIDGYEIIYDNNISINSYTKV